MNITCKKLLCLFSMLLLYAYSYGQISFNNQTAKVPGPTLTAIEPVAAPASYTGLSSFGLRKEEGSIFLKWEMFETTAGHTFEIERSNNSPEWLSIGTMESEKGNSYYEFQDRYPKLGTSFYRIKQIDLEGKINYSQVLKVEIDERDFPNSFKVYPNPADEMAYVELPTLAAEGSDLFLFNQLGREVYRQKVVAPLAQLDLANFEPGIYHLKLKMGLSSWNQRIVVR